ncbi:MULTISPECIES: carboxypeptidase-like regulatory domain-containing protein [Flavobacterium]|uniref:Carboxypeptidase-like regulatory domain-containing protein n=1 Tax=Flavobacterium keumense TaxID=1306518 RepID=A0ABY8N7C3_9FLAO|nr:MULTISPECIES: carboxypeptidase-like regulatory domain-containing protein [Flavobacterium]WGK95560.1 carboxypeptidase-like regulatory domain-containing protein [Flavobacterium keumense]
MKKLLLFFALGLFANGYAQNIRFEGVIMDSGKAPLEMANVMAVNQTTKAMDAYAITSDKGKFVLNLKANTSYTIKLSYIGMQNKEITVATKSENIVQNITMESGGIELAGVEIVREMPVSIKGDTIVYNADSFKSGTERKLEDVIKKLPGVEINSDGEVEVEGKKVSKLMVDGKDFFKGDTKLGVKNIPADAIDKVQFLRNYNENSILKGVENNQDNVAMNIKLKSGKKNFWFGDISAAGGINDTNRYLVNPKLFYYSPNYSINLITNFNNIGELPLTVQDYFKFTGGFKNMMSKGGSSFNISSNDLGISLMRNNRAKEIETQFGAANFTYNVTKAWTLSGFGIILNSNSDLETKSTVNILNPSSNQIASTENRDEVTSQKSNLGLFKLGSIYKPNSKFQLDYDILSKLSKQDENSSLLRQSIVNYISTNETIFTGKKQDPTSLNQNLSAYFTQSDKNVFAVEMQHLYQDENPFYNANLQSQPFSLIGYLTGQNRNDLSQNRFVKTNKLDAKLDYYYMITPKSNINITIGNTNSNQNFNSSIYQILDGGGINKLTDSQNNNSVNYKFNDAFLGLHYKFLSGKFTITPGVSFHAYDMTNTQLGNSFNQNFFRILPDFLTIYQIKKAETLTYNFGFTNSFTDINRLAEGFVFNNYNSLSKGSRTLENATQQNHSLRYFKYNMFNLENISANLSYSKTVDAIKTQSVFNGVNQSSSPYNSDFADESASAFAMYGRSFLKNYKASFNTRLGWSKFNNIQNATLTVRESFTQTHTITAATNYKNLPNLEIGYSLTVNDYNNSKFYTDKPFVKLDYYFLKSFSFVSEYEFYHYYNGDKTVNNEYDFLSASLIYQRTKESKLEYKISATNLLNTTSLNDDSFSQFSTRTSQYTVQPRYILFSLKYNL